MSYVEEVIRRLDVIEQQIRLEGIKSPKDNTDAMINSEAIRTAQLLLEKQIPKRIIITTVDINHKEIECPICHNLIPKGIGEVEYCSWCGQKVRWR